MPRVELARKSASSFNSGADFAAAASCTFASAKVRPERYKVLYAPLILGLGVAFTVSVTGLARLVVNWPTLLLAYGFTAAMAAGAIWLVNSATPAGREHASDVRRILQLARAMAGKKLRFSICVA